MFLSMFLSRLSCRESRRTHTNVSITSAKVSNSSRHETKEVFSHRERDPSESCSITDESLFQLFPLSFNNQNIHRRTHPHRRINLANFRETSGTANNGTDVYGAMLHVSAKGTLRDDETNNPLALCNVAADARPRIALNYINIYGELH